MHTDVLLRGNALELLRQIPDNSVDSVVTDPPYGISFMAKGWDTFAGNKEYAAWCEQWSRECLRVLKPGGYLLAFSGTRTYHALAWGVESAGFEIRDMIEWLYISGFPKSMDVGKQFDKRNGKPEPDDEFRAYIRGRMNQVGISSKQLDRLLGTNGMVGHYIGKSQPEFPTIERWSIIKLALELDDRYDHIIEWAEAEREKIGEYRGATQTGQSGINGFNGSTADENGMTIVDITLPSTPLAKKWDGWGTALKPSHEPIVMARKPLTGTVCANVEQYGTGAINVDGCRIQRQADGRFEYGVTGNQTATTGSSGIYGHYDAASYTPDEAGRFPANCVTADDDAWYSKYFNVTPQSISKKASKADRNSTWDGQSINVEERVTTDGRRKPIDNPYNRGDTLRQNHHPTVKPIDLMAWLIRLVTPPNGIILDPFAGSGSTLVAAKREGFRYIGIERSDDYADIADKRLAA